MAEGARGVYRKYLHRYECQCQCQWWTTTAVPRHTTPGLEQHTRRNNTRDVLVLATPRARTRTEDHYGADGFGFQSAATWTSRSISARRVRRSSSRSRTSPTKQKEKVSGEIYKLNSKETATKTQQPVVSPWDLFLKRNCWSLLKSKQVRSYTHTFPTLFYFSNSPNTQLANSSSIFTVLFLQVDFPGYCDGHSGIWNLAPGQTMFLKMLPWWKAGARIHVHSNGDAAQDATLHSLAALQTAKPRFDHRFCFEHFGCSNEALVRRVKMLGANVSVNPYYPHLRAKLNTERLGIDRASATSNFRLIKDNGITVASHTDTPVAPPRPLEEVWIACNRFCEDSEEVIAPAERITVQEALRMKTCDAAHVIGLDALIGSIEAGKMADFTVLSEDPQEIPKVKIRDVRVCATVVDGRISKEGWKLPCASEIPEGFWGGFLWLFKQTSPKHSWSRWFWASLLNLFNLFN